MSSPFDGQADDRNQFTGRAEAGGMFMGQRYVVQESAHLDAADSGGAITVEGGETKTIARWEDEGPLGLFALGATDASDTVYTLKVDGEIVSSLQSPTGTVVNPFSFVDYLGRPLGAENKIEYEVRNEGTGSQDYVARLFLGVLG